MIPIVASAIVLAVSIALLALGFTLQFITIGIPNLAHSSTFVLMAYLAYLFSEWGYTPYASLPAAFLIAGSMTFLIYKLLAYMKKRGSRPESMLIATLAIALIIYGGVNIFADYIASLRVAGVRNFTLAPKDFEWMGLVGIVPISVLACVSFITIFHLVLTRTKFGTAMRAIIENPELAEMQGVNTDLVLSVSWFFIGGLAGISGILYSMWYYVEPVIWVSVLTRILCACVIGGLASPWGSFMGGITVGFAEVLGIYVLASWLGPWIFPYRLAIPTLLVPIVLILSPRGLIEIIWRRPK